VKEDYLFITFIRREVNPDHYYINITINVERRLAEHKAGKSPHTNKFKPGTLTSYISFTNGQKAKKFEVYLKSGSGRIFCKKHF